MSELAIFAIGIVIFAVTVYGSVVVGGLKLTKDTLQRDDDLRRRLGADVDVDDGLPTDAKF